MLNAAEVLIVSGGVAISNAGFIFFGTLLQQLASSQGTAAEQSQETYGQAINQLSRGPLQPSLSSVLSSIQGVIIDSAPSRITPDIAARCERRANPIALYDCWRSLFWHVHAEC